MPLLSPCEPAVLSQWQTILSVVSDVLQVEAACERWGSFLHSLYDDVAGSGPQRLGCRLFLREAGLQCEGSVSDELMLSELTRLLLDQGLGPSLKRKRRSGAGTTSYALRDTEGTAAGAMDSDAHRPSLVSLVFSWAAPKTMRPEFEPRVLEDRDTIEALRTNTVVDLQSRRSILQALPMFREDARTTRKSRAGSVLRSCLEQWLQSPAAEDWRKQRAQLWQVDACAEDEGAGGCED